MTHRILIMIFLSLFAVACSPKSAPQTENARSEAASDSATTTMPVAAALPRSASAAGASVFFITPEGGATVSNPIKIAFGISGMDVVKAGTQQAHSGHHHLLIDTDLPTMGMPIPADEHHVHFGDGSTATEISLPPGQHTLQMLLGDYLHIPHDPPLASEVITIIVE